MTRGGGGLQRKAKKFCWRTFVAVLGIAGFQAGALGEMPETTQSGSEAETGTPANGDETVAGFVEIMTLEIRHDYFQDGLCAACVVVPTSESAALLGRADARFRFQGGSGLIVAPSTGFLSDDDVLRFSISATDRAFQQYTSTEDPVLSAENAEFRLIQNPASPGWALVEVHVGSLPMEVTIDLTARQVLWRWIIVPGPKADTLADWTIRRANAPDTPLDLDPPAAVDVDGQPAWLFALRELLPLREIPPEEQVFILIPPADAAADAPIHLPSAGAASLRSTVPGAPIYADMFVFL